MDDPIKRTYSEFCARIFNFNPVYWFFIASFVSHGTWRVVIAAAIGTAIGSGSIQTIGAYCSRLLSAFELRKDRRLEKGDLKPITIGSLKNLIPYELWFDIASARVEKGPLWRKYPQAQGNEIYIFLYIPRTLGAPWTPGNAFLGSVGQRVAIVRDDPMKALRPWSRFLFLHELAHVCSEGVRLQVARWRMFLTMVHAIATVLILGSPFSHQLPLTLVLVAAALSIWSFLDFEKLCESYADSFAFRLLPCEEDRQRVLKLMSIEASAAVRQFGNRHFHTRLWRARVDSLHGPRVRSLFNVNGGTIFDPSPIPFILASVGAVIVGWEAPLMSYPQLWGYVAWCGCCQAGAVAMLLWARHADAGVRIALHKKICD
jgi:hypothetical protein